jgi:hypothetical protein
MSEKPQSILVGEFAANSRETARVTLKEYKEHRLVRLSKWWPNEHGELCPGKSSCVANVRHRQLLSDLFSQALKRARELGLIEKARR